MRTLNESVERCGEVVRFSQGRAQIRLEPNAGCAGCGSRHTCASGDAAPLMIELAMPGDVQPGERVTVAMPAASLTLAALLGYLLPPVALLIGAIVANLAFGSDLAAVLGAAGAVRGPVGSAPDCHLRWPNAFSGNPPSRISTWRASMSAILLRRHRSVGRSHP